MLNPLLFRSYRIHPTITQWHSSCFDIRGDIFPYQGSALKKTVFSDPDELVNRAHAAENGIIFNDHMSGNLGIITHYTIITHDTVMRQMAIRLDKAIASDGRLFPDPSFPGLLLQIHEWLYCLR